MGKKEGKKRKRRTRTHRVGAPPGTVTVDAESPVPRIRLTAYGPDEVVEREIAQPGELEGLVGKRPVTWINVDGLGSAETIKEIGRIFDLHPLMLEDIAHVHQRPKQEVYGERLFIVVRMVSGNEHLETEQVSLVLGPRFLITFQEREGDCLDPVRQRIRAGVGRVRSAGADYLAYALIDAIIDGYFPVLEAYGERVEKLQEEVLLEPDERTVSKVQELKHDLMAFRRVTWPLRDTLAALLREETPLIEEETRAYLRDCYDHVIQVIDMIETHREVAAGLMDVYLSSVSNRMNEVMKVLTIIATIFIPLTFIAGIYGMNFNPEASRWNMPELNWPWGYPATLAAMALVAVLMVVYFKRKRWL